MRTDTIVEAVRQELLDRSKRGQTKYGTTMDRVDLDVSEWSQHLYEELLDAALYVKRLMSDIDSIPKPQQEIPASEIASDVMSLSQIRALDMGWEQRLELHGAIESVVRKALLR